MCHLQAVVAVCHQQAICLANGSPLIPFPEHMHTHASIMTNTLLSCAAFRHVKERSLTVCGRCRAYRTFLILALTLDGGKVLTFCLPACTAGVPTWPNYFPQQRPSLISPAAVNPPPSPNAPGVSIRSDQLAPAQTTLEVVMSLVGANLCVPSSSDLCLPSLVLVLTCRQLTLQMRQQLPVRYWLFCFSERAHLDGLAQT